MKAEGKKIRKRNFVGSALILAVVLTSLLAIIGVMFVMIARVDKMATSAISENKELNFAVETVVAKISQELTLDVPGVAGQEYYDYPGEKDKWLASLEPYKDGTNYKWRQISDVYNRFGPVELGLKATIIPDNQKPSDVGDSNRISGYPADADGDGVADSNWVIIPDMTSNKGKPIYAAIRIIDNGGMINVNTAYKFDPDSAVKNKIDGSNQAQINLAALRRGTTKPFSNLDNMRKGGETSWDLDRYIDDVVWQIERPAGLWTPFDISDELKLRNRYILNYNLMVSRIEGLWTKVYDWGLRDPRTDPVEFAEDSENGRNYWFFRTYNGSADPNIYDYRHISTTYNMDRIIDPNGKKMININRADANSIYRAIRSALDPNLAGANGTAAQIAVNLIDLCDYDSNVSTIKVDGIKYYGFERPCVYISEMVHKLKDINPGGPIGAPPVLVEAYAIELYKPYSQDEDPNNWRLVLGPAPGGPIGAPLGGTPYDIHWSGHRQFYVMRNDPCGLLTSIDPCAAVENSAFVFTKGSIIGLQRRIDEVNKVWIDVDLVDVPDGLVPDPCSDIDLTRSIERDIKLHKCIRRLWSPPITNSPTLGRKNDNYTDPNSRLIQAHPEDKPFTNVGEIGMVFQKSAYSQEGLNPIGRTDTEHDARVDLADPCYQNLFQYLTVFDPNVYPWNDPNETRIRGRININTAPWYVIAQLPWMRSDIAQKIVEHRDQPTIGGFESISDLMQVPEMGYYANDSNDLAGFPDLTTLPTGGDGAPDDFEERDVIFARISNLVTVRSDVFTAYILVRIGTNGPQKRVMAILDRSNVSTGDGKVRIIALHPVPDPR
jgi:hypothetical protein